MLPRQNDIVRTIEDCEGEGWIPNMYNSWIELSDGDKVKLPKGTFLRYSKTGQFGTKVFVIPPPSKARRFIKKIKGKDIHFYQIQVIINPYMLKFYCKREDFDIKDVERFYCGTED